LVQSPNTECARCEEALNGLGRDGWRHAKRGNSKVDRLITLSTSAVAVCC
jgi:hypothetical protein